MTGTLAIRKCNPLTRRKVFKANTAATRIAFTRANAFDVETLCAPASRKTGAQDAIVIERLGFMEATVAGFPMHRFGQGAQHRPGHHRSISVRNTARRGVLLCRSNPPADKVICFISPFSLICPSLLIDQP